MPLNRPGIALAWAHLVKDGEPWEGCLRTRLDALAQNYAELGLELRVAFELEFHLLELRGGRLVAADNVSMFALDGLDRRHELLGRVFECLRAIGVPAHQLAKEYGPGLYELSLFPSAPLDACDDYCHARESLRSVARDYGLVASFMPKPFPDGPGAGLHVHVSITAAEKDQPAVEGLAAPAASHVAGILRSAGGLTAVAAPTVNSYGRLVPGSWAPAHAAWGFGNRSALIRVPGRANSSHIEFRAGDGSANPYAYLLGILGCGLAGIREGLMPPAPTEFDLGHVSSEGPDRLPITLGEALDAFEADEMIQASLGPLVYERYLALKRHEDSAGEIAVEDWERDRGLD
jgi:glutamine synthetase